MLDPYQGQSGSTTLMYTFVTLASMHLSVRPWIEKRSAFSCATICPERRGTLEEVEGVEEGVEGGEHFMVDLITELLLLSLLVTRSEPVSCCCILPTTV
jgi:hypothetical protein